MKGGRKILLRVTEAMRKRIDDRKRDAKQSICWIVDQAVEQHHQRLFGRARPDDYRATVLSQAGLEDRWTRRKARTRGGKETIGTCLTATGFARAQECALKFSTSVPIEVLFALRAWLGHEDIHQEGVQFLEDWLRVEAIKISDEKLEELIY